MNPIYLVSLFQKKFGWEVGAKPALINRQLAQKRIDCLKEELKELQEAVEADDLEGVADALIDLDYFVLGTANLYGIGTAWGELFADVHRANMAKKRGVGKRGHVHDVVKPADWVGPETGNILRRHGWKGEKP